jgi:hypothetical protein
MKRPLIHLLAGVTAALLSLGCAQNPKPAQSKQAGSSEAFSEPGGKREFLQRELMNFADRFASSTAATYDELAAAVPKPEAKRIAIERKVAIAESAFANATEESPIVGLLDMLVMTRLLRETAQDPWFSEIFGDHVPKVVIKLRVQEEDIWTLAARYLTEAQLKELSDAIQRWREAHPAERYVSMVRLSEFPEAQSSTSAAAGAKAPSSVFGLLFLDPFASLDPAMRQAESYREAADRYYFYLQRMPTLLSWRVDSTSRQLLNSSELQQFMDNTAKFTSATSSFADSVKTITGLLKQFPQQLSDERNRAVEHVAQKTTQERSAAVTQVSHEVAQERDAAIKQVAQAVATERDQIARIATTAVAAERKIILTECNAALQNQRELLISDLAAATERATYRFFILECGVVILAIALVAVLIRRTRAAARTHELVER